MILTSQNRPVVRPTDATVFAAGISTRSGATEEQVPAMRRAIDGDSRQTIKGSSAAALEPLILPTCVVAGTD
jgi:hypothetical protein